MKLEEAVQKLCEKRHINYGDYTATDPEGNILDLSKTLDELELAEIYFGSTRTEWEQFDNIIPEKGN